MARQSKISTRSKIPQKSVEELLKTIVEDVVQTDKLPLKEWIDQCPSPLALMVISDRQGREYRVTKKGMDAARELAKQTWEAKEDFRQTLSREESYKLSFAALVDAIAKSPTHLPGGDVDGATTLVEDSFYVAVADDYGNSLTRLAGTNRADIDRHIPCNLFQADQRVPGFVIGPVHFRPRTDWIDRFIDNPEERESIRRVEAGELSLKELQQQSLSHGTERRLYNAWTVLSTLRGFAWVGTVRLVEHGLGQSHYKASALVGLAMDALGLRFHAGDARRFTKAGRSHLFAEEQLATLGDGRVLHGSTIQMPGLSTKAGVLAARVGDERPFLDAAGRILSAYVDGRQAGRAPHLIERWVNALYWVGEARREASDFMAVVDYGCAADGLSGAGGSAENMIRFAEAALNPKSEPTPAGTMSIDDAVTMVYREGRHKIAHGEAPGLFEDLADSRTVGDTLLVSLFDVVTMELATILDQRPQILQVDEKNAYRALEARLRQRP